MTHEQILQWLIAIIGSVVAWSAKTMRDSVAAVETDNRRLDERINGLEILIASQYVRSDRFDATVNALFQKMDRVEDKQDRIRDSLEEIRDDLGMKINRDELRERHDK